MNLEAIAPCFLTQEPFSTRRESLPAGVHLKRRMAKVYDASITVYVKLSLGQPARAMLKQSP
jgi:hypothetical protein